MNRLKEFYNTEVVDGMISEFSYPNKMAVPKIEKVIVNMGLSDAKEDSRVLEHAQNDLRAITGQQPIITYAKKSVANFRLREGMPVGAKVTLRGDKMYSFVDRLINVTIPRIRDFQGVSGKSFDGRGNYTLGIREQIVFPEIDYDDIDKIRGMDITIVTTAQTDEEAYKLLELFGMPFRK